MIRLFITEDHDIYLKGLTLLLQESNEIIVVNTASNGSDTISHLSQQEQDVLLLDIQLPDISAEVLLKDIRKRFPQLPVIYHTMLRGTRYLHKLMQSGIQGYILKNAGTPELLHAIKTVNNGGNYFSKEIDISDGTEDDYKKTLIVPGNKHHEILSKRETEILQMICKEYSNAEIAAKLFLSVSTVDTHRKNIIEKVGANNTVGLVKFALKNGMIPD